LGSLDPPLRTTFLGGGQGFRAAGSAFFDPEVVDPEVVEPGVVDPSFAPASVEFVESAGLPTAVFSAVGAFEQFGGVFL
jgi:hypothetical protein